MTHLRLGVMATRHLQPLALLLLGRDHVCGLTGGNEGLAVLASSTRTVLQVHLVGGCWKVVLLAAGTGGATD